MAIVIRRFGRDGYRLSKPHKTKLWKFLHSNQIDDTPRLKRPTQKDVDVSFDDYNDYCTECSKHGKCHKNGIDYNKIAKCKEETINLKV